MTLTAEQLADVLARPIADRALVALFDEMEAEVGHKEASAIWDEGCKLFDRRNGVEFEDDADA